MTDLQPPSTHWPSWLRRVLVVCSVLAVGLAVAYLPFAGRGDDSRADDRVEPSASPSPSASASSPTPEPTQPATPPTGTGSPSDQPPRKPRVAHVVVVSLDGFGSELIDRIGLAQLPALSALTADGASTFNARTEVEATVTLPNHAGMLTGRPVFTEYDGHGVTVNEDTGQTVQQLAGHDVASAFDVVHAAGGSTALFSTKDKFAMFARSWDPALDRFEYLPDDRVLMSAAIADLVSSRRTFTFVHLGLVDEVGHASGWLSSRQVEAAHEADDLVGELVAAVASDPKLARRVVIVVTADHGGVGRDHGDSLDPRNFTVPFVVQGATVASGADLYALNPSLADPGDSQPFYDAAQGPVRNGFVANVVTALLGLEPVPGSTLGRDGLVLAKR
jgi:Type I phosphodiesterase / nucleotide pyrophosphatase